MLAIYKIINSKGKNDTIQEPARIFNGRLEIKGKFGWISATGSLRPDEIRFTKQEFDPIESCLLAVTLVTLH